MQIQHIAGVSLSSHPAFVADGPESSQGIGQRAGCSAAQEEEQLVFLDRKSLFFLKKRAERMGQYFGCS
jgi:hypothetical protein